MGDFLQSETSDRQDALQSVTPDETRERLARVAFDHAWPVDEPGWEQCSERTRERWRGRIDAILAEQAAIEREKTDG